MGHSQTGYLPIQPKLAVIELDKNDKSRPNASLLRVNDDGSTTEVLTTKPKEWGRWQRYDYVTFDFSSVTKPGVYKLSYGKQTTLAFPIADDVYQRAWHNTLDVFLPVQMDHMFVREAYRVWHGAPHLDDALQAPVNYSHWDGWRQGPVTGNKYKPLEHIPGLNVGGWFDAGDFDIQTPSQQAVINALVQLWEEFDVARDETLIDQANRYVEIHLPTASPMYCSRSSTVPYS
nr:cellulase N-terminal Ig-like domain-containing protein [Bacteroides reticulotermitis]